MSGFFGHLAARAMGEAGAVHSVARLPYAAAPTLLEATGDGAALPSPALHGASPVDGVPPAPRGSSPGPAGATEAEDPAVIGGQTPADEPAQQRATSQDRGKAHSEASKAPNAPWVAPPAPALLARPAARTIPAAVEGEPGEMRQGAKPFPQPLLPLQLAERGAAQSPAAAAVRRPERPAWRGVEESPEVHVSIGRIEVTAVHEAPAPKRIQPKARQALSLEEYLARRQRGRS